MPPLKKTKDHGHIFPASIEKVFDRNHSAIPGAIRSTLRNPSRFWNIDDLAEEVEGILGTERDLTTPSAPADRWRQAVLGIVGSLDLESRFSHAVNWATYASEWENLLVAVLGHLYPGWAVERTAGREEARHGTDILMTTPALGGGSYGIAIQVKDYTGLVGNDAVDQVKMADRYWNGKNINIIDRVVAIIGSDKEVNADFSSYAGGQGVRVLWSRDINGLLLAAAGVEIARFASSGVSE